RETSWTEPVSVDNVLSEHASRQVTERVTEDSAIMVRVEKPKEDGLNAVEFSVEQRRPEGSASPILYAQSIHFADGATLTTIQIDHNQIKHHASSGRIEVETQEFLDEPRQ
ncbi:MAG: hypothetical protein J2P37_33685, partial [Ktedonobacteraceae bacterium]|nr:hypothetical protein [Ktedonobacteraceae bacterium]